MKRETFYIPRVTWHLEVPPLLGYVIWHSNVSPSSAVLKLTNETAVQIFSLFSWMYFLSIAVPFRIQEEEANLTTNVDEHFRPPRVTSDDDGPSLVSTGLILQEDSLWCILKDTEIFIKTDQKCLLRVRIFMRVHHFLLFNSSWFEFASIFQRDFSNISLRLKCCSRSWLQPFMGSFTLLFAFFF